MTYSPQYVSIQSIPIQVPDDYTDEDKIDALEYAESTLEVELNEGEEITQDQVITMMEAAVKQLATCQLVKSATHPDDVTLGDIEDAGDTKVSYADSFCDAYDDTVDRIIRSGILEDKDEGQSNAPFTFTTGIE